MNGAARLGGRDGLAGRAVAAAPSLPPQPDITPRADLARRRRAAWRLVPLADGRRDPLDAPSDPAEPAAALDVWAAALAHLKAAGLQGIPPRHVGAALRARPVRYAAVLPR